MRGTGYVQMLHLPHLCLNTRHLILTGTETERGFQIKPWCCVVLFLHAKESSLIPAVGRCKDDAELWLQPWSNSLTLWKKDLFPLIDRCHSDVFVPNMKQDIARSQLSQHSRKTGKRQYLTPVFNLTTVHFCKAHICEFTSEPAVSFPSQICTNSTVILQVVSVSYHHTS